MKILMYKKSLKLHGPAGISEEHLLKIGTYNEFYLPSVDRDHELWIVVTDENGVETKLHLKR
jgi:hypothetical protein